MRVLKSFFGLGPSIKWPSNFAIVGDNKEKKLKSLTLTLEEQAHEHSFQASLSITLFAIILYLDMNGIFYNYFSNMKSYIYIK